VRSTAELPRRWRTWPQACICELDDCTRVVSCCGCHVIHASPLLKPRLWLPHPHRILVPLLCFAKTSASAFPSTFVTSCSTSHPNRTVTHPAFSPTPLSLTLHASRPLPSLSSGTIYSYTPPLPFSGDSIGTEADLVAELCDPDWKRDYAL